MKLSVTSTKPREIIDITAQVQESVNVNDGVAMITVAHTTCAITTADLDPGTDQDFLDFLIGIVPRAKWRHPHNPAHAPSHLLASLIGPSVSIPISAGKLVLGTWQRIILVELDGPRERQITSKVISVN